MSGGGALEASVTLDEVMTVVGAKRVPLAPELAGYLALDIAEHADAAGGDVEPRSVIVSEEGTVALVRPRREPTTGDAEASIRAILARLLEASGSQTPALAAASKRRSGAGLPALVEELEGALIPVNRAAGRRALARLAREVKRVLLGVGRHTLPSSSSLRSRLAREDEPASARAPQSAAGEAAHRAPLPANWSELPTTEFAPGARAPSPSEADVDSLIAQFGVTGGGEQQHARALRAVAGIDATPPPPAQAPRAAAADVSPARPPATSPQETDIESLLALHDPAPAQDQPPPRPAATGGATALPTRPDRPALLRPESPSTDTRQMPTQPSQLKKGPAQASVAGAARVPAASGASGRIGWAPLALMAVAAVSVGSYGVWRLRQGALAERQSLRSDVGATPLPAQESAHACVGTLMVTDVPGHAEVLLRQGQAPLDIPRMPVGARLEFVATAEGYAPKRVVVPAGGGWDPGPDGRPRYEAAVQLDASRARPGSTDPWPAGEPGSEVGGQGPPGTVHVVATPRGAEVWMLAGIGPEARIDQVRCDEDIDVLVAGPTTYRKRLHVAAGDFASEPAAAGAPSAAPARVARVSAR